LKIIQTYKKYKSKEETSVKLQIKEVKKAKKPKQTNREAFEFALTLKEKLVSAKTITGYRSRMNIFLDWLDKNEPDINELKTIIKGARYFPVNNMDPSEYGECPYFDVETGNVVYFSQ